jgi:hypothetical protein
MDRNDLHSLTSSKEDKTGLYHIVIGLFIFVLIVILMETHNYYTGKYDKVKDDDDVKDADDVKDTSPLHPLDLSNINVIRRKNTVIIN